MAELTVKYTAPLPAGFTSGTLEIKRPTVYIDAAGRKAQAYYRATINADRSLTDVQTGRALKIVAAGQGDPDGGYLDWIETLNVEGLSTPLRQAHRIPAIYTGAGVLDLHQPDRTAKLVDVPVGSEGSGGIQAVLSDGLTVTGDGVSTPLSTPGYDAWIGRFWRRNRGQENVLDATQRPDRFVKVAALDFTNYTVGGISEGFNARFEGIVTPKYSEKYKLIYYVDDACRIYLDDALIVDNWTNPAASDGGVRRSADLGVLTVDRPYRMRVEWCQMQAGANAMSNPNRLYIGWSSASQAEQAIPTVGGDSSANSSPGAITTTTDLTGNGSSTNPLGIAKLGAAGGIATLGIDGKVPAAQLPTVAIISGRYTWRASKYNAVVNDSRSGNEQVVQSGYAGFYIIQLDDPGADWDASANAWICPADGTYQITTKLRYLDGTVGGGAGAGVSYGQGAHTSLTDGPWFAWFTTASKRNGSLNTRLITLTTGQRVYLYSYTDNTQYVTSAEMFIVRQS